MKLLEERIARFYHRRQGLFLSVLAAVLVLAAVVDVLFFHTRTQDYFHGFDLLVIVLFLAFVTLAIGAHVGQAVFHVAAGFTLITYLAESYCSIAVRSAGSDDAFRALLAVGILYIIFDFLHTLYRGLYRFEKRTSHLAWDTSKVLILAVFLALACVFAFAVYSAMSPIISGMCIYR